MENASKALLMAAGVLIGVLVLSLAVYLFVSFGSTSAELRKQKEAQELEQFNSQFISYEGKEGITIYDVVTVASIAKENNKYYELTPRPIGGEWTDYYVAVNLNEAGYGPIQNHNNYNELIQDYLDTKMINRTDNGETYLALKEFTCNVEINATTGRVYKVYFTPRP